MRAEPIEIARRGGIPDPLELGHVHVQEKAICVQPIKKVKVTVR
jgi:hypothetical protein